MNRCVVIQRTGISQVQDVPPDAHRRLRRLEFRRFVMEYVRAADGWSVTSALYAQTLPSAWQITDAARKLWGRGAGVSRVFDENGHLVATGSGDRPLGIGAALPAAPAPADPSDPEAPQGATRQNDIQADRGAEPRSRDAVGHRVGVDASDPVVIEQLFGDPMFPRLRVTALVGRGWVVEALLPVGGASGSSNPDDAWRELFVVATPVSPLAPALRLSSDGSPSPLPAAGAAR